MLAFAKKEGERKSEMKAIRLEKPGQFETIELEEPAHPAPGEALVRVHRVGICAPVSFSPRASFTPQLSSRWNNWRWSKPLPSAATPSIAAQPKKANTPWSSARGPSA